MGIGLIVEVLTHAPEELGPPERMVLVAIAEDARDTTRESWSLTRAELCRRTGMKPEALKKAFQRLAKAGLEVRVPLKFGANGQPVYAYEGKQCRYRIPRLIERGEEVPASEEGTESPLSNEEEGTDSPLSGRETGTGSPHSPREEGTQSPLSTERGTQYPLSAPEEGTGSPHSTPEEGTQYPLWVPEGGINSPEGGTGSPPTPHIPSTSSPSEKRKGGAGGRTRRGTDEEPPTFAEWYATYPIHKARGAAVKAYAKALRKTDAATLLAAAKRYRDDPQVRRGYGKHPATWLNQECWLDEPDNNASGASIHQFPGNRYAPGSGSQVPPRNSYSKENYI